MFLYMYIILTSAIRICNRYQLIIQDADQTVWIGLPTEELCRKWMNLIITTVEKSPEESRMNLMLPYTILAMEAVHSIMAEAAVEDDAATPLDDTASTVGGNNTDRGRSSSIFGFLNRTDSNSGKSNTPAAATSDGPRRGTIRAMMSMTMSPSTARSGTGDGDSPRGRSETMQRAARAMSVLSGKAMIYIVYTLCIILVKHIVVYDIVVYDI